MRTRIVTVCIKGEPLEKYKDNKVREKILEHVVKNVKNKWKGLDAIVFPGGFFYSERYIGNLSFRKRVKVLSKTSFHKTCIKMCRKLSKGSLIIAGVDSEKPKKTKIRGEWGDQLCMAWSKNGIEGIGRKIFPVNGDENKHYICYLDDFITNKRIVKLRNGEKAVLCACYDMYGCSEEHNDYNKRTKDIKHLFPEEDLKSTRKKYSKDFIKLLKSEKVTVGIVAIHSDPTRYWQCHGIDTCSATLRGIAVGASHFSNNLPKGNKMTLVSYKADEKILNLRDKRLIAFLINN